MNQRRTEHEIIGQIESIRHKKNNARLINKKIDLMLDAKVDTIKEEELSVDSNESYT